MRAARADGINEATDATAPSTAATATNTAGSDGRTSNSKADIMRVRANVPAAPPPRTRTRGGPTGVQRKERPTLGASEQTPPPLPPPVQKRPCAGLARP